VVKTHPAASRRIGGGLVGGVQLAGPHRVVGPLPRQWLPAGLSDLSPGSVDNSVGNAAMISLKWRRSGHFCSLPKVCAVRKLLKLLATFREVVSVNTL
jgi:hypothetical protein